MDTSGEARELALGLALSTHARVRMQQRGIPPKVVESLLQCGRVQHDHHGGRIVFFDRSAWHRACQDGFGSLLREAGRYRRAYLVLGDDGMVRTVSHRYRRIKRS
ncbi:MAG: DUF4258 domain-containing protein [Gammaproteobacteria bacterium]|nr:DUF4258 domain-containing protein [Gammaproteobacteria bacterium]